MALRTFGGGPADITTDATGNVISGVQLQVFTAATGGQRVTELYDPTGAPLPGVVTSSTTPEKLGRIEFSAAEEYSVLFLDPGYGMRWVVPAREAFALTATAVAKAETAYDLASQAASKTDLENSVTHVQNHVENQLQSAADPVAFIDRVRVVSVFPMYYDAEPSVYMQGFSINKNTGELYGAFGGGSSAFQRFEVRDLATGAIKSKRTVPSDLLSYTEGLPYFYNNANHLCFIVRLQASANTTQTYQILDMETGDLSTPITINGKVRGDVSGNYYVTTDAYGSKASQFWIYDWQSVTRGSPQLLATIPISNPGKTPMKMQGVATTGSHFYLVGGDPTQDPTVAIYDNQGQLVSVRSWTRAEFMQAVNTSAPGTLTISDFEWESEGATNVDGRLYTGHVVSNKEPRGAGYQRYVVILQHGDAIAPRMSPTPLTSYQADSGWIDLPLDTATYVTKTAGRKAQYRMRDGELMFYGIVERKDQVKMQPDKYLSITDGPLPDDILPEQPLRSVCAGDGSITAVVLAERDRPIRVNLSAQSLSVFLENCRFTLY